MKGHTGATLSMGSGSVYSSSAKQKLVTRSSTKSEVVGVHDIAPQIIWTANFLRAQGLQVKESCLYQDNVSSILLEKNGRRSSTKRTKHMDIRYFFIQDRVKQGDVKIEHCPTGKMVADFYTKPLQGSLFRRLRDIIMNVSTNDSNDEEPHQNHRSVLEEKDTNDNDGGIKDVMNSDISGITNDVAKTELELKRSYKEALMKKS